MNKLYLLGLFIISSLSVFAQQNLVERYSFTGGNLIGENGTASNNGPVTYVEGHNGITYGASSVNNQTINLGNPTIDPSTGFSISFWLKPAATNSGSFSVLSKRSACSWNNMLEVVGNATSKKISCGFRTSSQKSTFVGLPYTDNVWTKFTYTFNNTTKFIYGYINDVKVDSSAYKDGFVPTDLGSSVNLTVAGSPCVGSDVTTRYKGALDEIELFSKPLTVLEVATMDVFLDRATALIAHYDMGKPLYTPTIADNEGTLESAIQLDGTEKVDLGKPAINNTNGFTIALWLKPSANNGAQFSVLSKRSVCTWTNLLDIVGNSNLNIISGGVRTSSQKSTFVALDYTDDEWAHFAYAFDNTTKRIYGYKNGGLVDSSDYADGFVPTDLGSTAELSIGGSPCVGADGTLRYKGGIDDIALYNETLTHAAIADLYNSSVITAFNGITATKETVLYPNPANEQLNIVSDKVGALSIFDALGKEVLKVQTSTSPIVIEHLNAGLYFYKLDTQDESYTGSFVKK